MNSVISRRVSGWRHVAKHMLVQFNVPLFFVFHDGGYARRTIYPFLAEIAHIGRRD
jgi:hypothetical protein